MAAVLVALGVCSVVGLQCFAPCVLGVRLHLCDISAYNHLMTDSPSGEQTCLQRFWLSENTRRLSGPAVVTGMYTAYFYLDGSVWSSVLLFAVTLVLTGIVVISWVKRREHNQLIVD